MSRCDRAPVRGASIPAIERGEASTPPLVRSQRAKGIVRIDEGEDMGELVCVIAIVRHGERTPKQKSKHKSSRPEWIDLYKRSAVVVGGGWWWLCWWVFGWLVGWWWWW